MGLNWVEDIDRHLSLKGKGADLEANEWQVISIGGKYSFNTFATLAQTLKIPFVSIMDYDALMRCDKKKKKSRCQIIHSYERRQCSTIYIR